MPNNPEMDRLQAKYNALYEKEAVDGLSEAEKETLHVEPAHVDDWPADRKQALVYLTRPGGRLLEIGCGQGEVLAALAPHFDEVVGTELSSVRAARTRLALAHLDNVRILSEPLENLPDTAVTPFDCIVWADVIEHIVDVIAAMRI
ncbi:MAG TPA: class I SAM-dependent methyltransferase, partial [Anaerolineae bacterium]|nr:class I SAM-dependent methyltransferase [Anaerolineae bacterium]